MGLIPSSVAELARHGHDVTVEAGAGAGAGLTDAEYRSAGAAIAPSADAIWSSSDLVVKVKEPLAPERKKLRPGQVLFTYLHLAADPEQTAELLASKRDLHRLRDRHFAVWRPAAADADVGGRGAAGAASRRALPRTRRRRARRAARWRAGRAGRRGGHPRRRHFRNTRRDHRQRHGRECHRRRPLGRCAPAARRAIRHERAHALLDAVGPRRTGQARRPAHLLRARARRGRAKAHHPRHAGRR